MIRAREITGIIYASVDMLHCIAFILAFGAFESLRDYTLYLNIASWSAFGAFAVAAFWQFSYTWLRVIAAFLVFYFLPIIVALVYARLTYLISTEWITITLVVLHLIRLAVAGLIYLWSVRRERGHLAAASAPI